MLIFQFYIFHLIYLVCFLTYRIWGPENTHDSVYVHVCLCVLGFEPRGLHLPGRSSTTELFLNDSLVLSIEVWLWVLPYKPVYAQIICFQMWIEASF